MSRRPGAPAPLDRCNRVGPGVLREGTLHVSNLGHIEIGAAVQFRSRLIASHLVTGPAGTLEIGEGAVFGHGLAVTAHRAVRIGANARIGPFALIMDTDFHEAGNHEQAGESAPIEIGAGARLGAHVTVLRGSTIGAGAVVEPGSVVKGDIPAGARVAGVPARADTVGAADGLAVSWESVSLVIRHALGDGTRTDPTTRREDIAQWDSLGALNLLLALEHRFGVDLAADRVASVQQLGELLPLVRDARRRP